MHSRTDLLHLYLWLVVSQSSFHHEFSIILLFYASSHLLQFPPLLRPSVLVFLTSLERLLMHEGMSWQVSSHNEIHIEQLVKSLQSHKKGKSSPPSSFKLNFLFKCHWIDFVLSRKKNTWKENSYSAEKLRNLFLLDIVARRKLYWHWK